MQYYQMPGEATVSGGMYGSMRELSRWGFRIKSLIFTDAVDGWSPKNSKGAILVQMMELTLNPTQYSPS